MLAPLNMVLIGEKTIKKLTILNLMSTITNRDVIYQPWEVILVFQISGKLFSLVGLRFRRSTPSFEDQISNGSMLYNLFKKLLKNGRFVRLNNCL